MSTSYNWNNPTDYPGVDYEDEYPEWDGTTRPPVEPDNICTECDGDGTVHGQLCKACNGKGHHE